MPERQTLDDAVAAMAADVRDGLTKPGQKELPSKYFYDDLGTALFEAITELPEYGLTRAGERLLRRYAPELVARVPDALVVELGSGTGKKTRWILEALAERQPVTYYPIDLSAAALEKCRRELGQPGLIDVVGLEASFLAGLRKVAAGRPPKLPLLVLFLGSTIGNFDRPVAQRFLGDVRGVLKPGDLLYLSTDLEKDVGDLLLAYDDPLGVTAAFNLNLLARLNRELEADFDLACFRHRALYNDAERRIEMHLVSTEAQTVTIPRAELSVEFEAEETIWTESSHKFSPPEVAEWAERAGFGCEAQWADRHWPFAQSLLVAR